MTERTSHLDPEERLRWLNPVPDPPSGTEIDAALRRLLARVPAAEASAGPAWPQAATRRRSVFGSGVAVTVAIAAFVVVNVLPASRTPGGVSNAWAKRVIAHTSVAVLGPGSGILHIVETTTGTINGTGSRHSFNYIDTFQSWDSQTDPDQFWSTNQDGSDNTSGPDTSALTLSVHTLESYDAASNTLHEVHQVPPARVAALEAEGNAGYAAALALTEQANVYPGAPRRTAGSSFQVPTFSDLIVALLNAPGVTVNPNASVSGEAAISITETPAANANARFTLDVQPHTYTPLLMTITNTNGSGAIESTNTTTFNTYETLPASSVTMPNLAQIYPNAKVISTRTAIDW
jgi:hypothetical protein